jgi:hypothetical protein
MSQKNHLNIAALVSAALQNFQVLVVLLLPDLFSQGANLFPGFRVLNLVVFP